MNNTKNKYVYFFLLKKINQRILKNYSNENANFLNIDFFENENANLQDF